MSLLPGQILPQSAILGRVNADGTVTIEQNWWLLLFNLCLQTLGTGAGLPADALIDLESVDIDAVGTDSAALRQPLSNALLLAQQLDDLSADVANLQKQVSNAILLALTTDQDIVALPTASLTIANPSGTVGLTAVNGSTGKVMDAGSAPPLSQAIAPTWTGVHLFSGSLTAVTATSGISIGSSSGLPDIQWTNSSGAANSKVWDLYADGTTLHGRVINDAHTGAQDWIQIVRNAVAITSVTFPQGTVGVAGALGVNGATPPAQSTGWGTPTGGAVANNFSGSAATLATLGPAVAQLIAVLKAVGILGT